MGKVIKFHHFNFQYNHRLGSNQQLILRMLTKLPGPSLTDTNTRHNTSKNSLNYFRYCSSSEIGTKTCTRITFHIIRPAKPNHVYVKIHVPETKLTETCTLVLGRDWVTNSHCLIIFLKSNNIRTLNLSSESTQSLQSKVLAVFCRRIRRRRKGKKHI